MSGCKSRTIWRIGPFVSQALSEQSSQPFFVSLSNSSVVPVPSGTCFQAMTSKAKKRVVLPTRPEPPNTEQILEDVQRAQPNDPVFVLLVEPNEDLPTPTKNEDPEAKRERLYRLTQSYVEMNHRLQKACSLLKEKCEELKLAGATLEQGILEMKQRAL
uniref:Chromosome 19 open reading frame 25 n=1 Tax=Pseudonaja textilis TaxID=8673 RepID=A0A670XUG0_PSETE